MPALSNRIRNIVTGDGDGWGVYYRARQMQRDGVPVTMLSIGDHDIATAPAIIDAMDQSARGGNLGYTPMNGTHRLRTAIAARMNRMRGIGAGPENVIVTSGGQGAIFSAMTAVLDPGDSCIVLDPFYASFDITVRAASGEAIIVPTRAEDAFQPDAALIEAALTPRTRAILMNTPNNPSGAVYTRARVEAVADLCIRRDLWLISDELYDSQVFDGAHVSARDLPGMLDRTIVIGSMSKGYAMTGARLGWAIAPEPVIGVMGDLAGATTYGLPGFIQDAATHALNTLGDQEAEIAERYRRRRDVALAALGNGPHARPVPSQGGMYIMVDIRATGLSGTEFAERLLDAEHIGVMPGESFGRAAAGHLRVALTVPEASLGDAMTRLARFAGSVAGSLASA